MSWCVTSSARWRFLARAAIKLPRTAATLCGASAPCCSVEQTRRIDIVLVAPGRGVINCHATATFTAIAGHRVQVYEPQLVIKMHAPDKVIAGETVNLIYEITNPGDGITEAIKVKTLPPEGLEHASGRRVIEFDAGNLPPKEMRRIQMPCVAKGAGPQHCKTDAVAEGNLSSKDAAQIEILTPKLAVALTGPRLRYLDRHAVYVVRVTNPGSAPAAGVEVHELIPAGFRFHQANQRREVSGIDPPSRSSDRGRSAARPEQGHLG